MRAMGDPEHSHTKNHLFQVRVIFPSMGTILLPLQLIMKSSNLSNE
jgi:hypothetical protein